MLPLLVALASIFLFSNTESPPPPVALSAGGGLGCQHSAKSSDCPNNPPLAQEAPPAEGSKTAIQEAIPASKDLIAEVEPPAQLQKPKNLRYKADIAPPPKTTENAAPVDQTASSLPASPLGDSPSRHKDPEVSLQAAKPAVSLQAAKSAVSLQAAKSKVSPQAAKSKVSPQAAKSEVNPQAAKSEVVSVSGQPAPQRNAPPPWFGHPSRMEPVFLTGPLQAHAPRNVPAPPADGGVKM